MLALLDREVFSVSRGQRISSRCGAVKSELCPKRLVTVERPPAIRVYLSVQPQGSRERSHSAPPPAPIPALRSSSPRLSGWLDTGWESSRNRGSLAAAAGDPGVPRRQQPPAAAVSAASLEESAAALLVPEPLADAVSFPIAAS